MILISKMSLRELRPPKSPKNREYNSERFPNFQRVSCNKRDKENYQMADKIQHYHENRKIIRFRVITRLSRISTFPKMDHKVQLDVDVNDEVCATMNLKTSFESSYSELKMSSVVIG